MHSYPLPTQNNLLRLPSTMATKEKPHLLTLPREIRDNISGILYWKSPFACPRTASTADSRVLSQIRHLELTEGVDTDPGEIEFGHKILSGEAFFRYIRVQLVPMLPRLKTLRFRTGYSYDLHTDHVCFESADYVVEPVSVSQTICGLKMIQVTSGCDFTMSHRRSFHCLHSNTLCTRTQKQAQRR
jgi:hypothetical protein